MNLLGLVCGQHEDSLAISAPDGTATYGQLLARAAQLAESYQSLGVEAGDRVGVVLAPGRDALAASLAAWILRAAYVPIDPTQPAARAVGILKRCGPKICVGFPAPGWEELDLRTPQSLAGDWPSPGVVPPEITAGPADDVAYVIHTSGSTGVSKGIEIEHHGVHQLILDVDERVPVEGRVVGSWWCSPDFDVSVWESWSILCTGGELVIPSPADRAEAARFAAFLDRSNVTNAYVPHGYLPALLELFRCDPGACRTMRRLMVGIEPIALGLLQDLLRERPDLSVINGYGPAEATVLCCLYVVPRTGGDPADRTPIGTATRGITFSFVDEELVISGEGVGRGYLNGTPEQLARFTITPETRSYRTGDRVRVLPDGNLLFLGRIDFQMKVRGYRIEPGEVETAVRALGTVSEVVVGQREVPGVGDAVVAYVVPIADFDPHRTRAALRDVLPAYALPSAFVVVDEIPMTAKNGKVNRKALAELPLPAQETGPVTGDLIVDAWRAELGVEIPPGLGFVDLGGSSLPAVRVAHTLREATGKDISAADVLAARSPADLAEILANASTATDGPIAEGRRSGPLSPNQLGLWMHDQITQGTRAYPLPHCFVLPDPDPERVADALSRAIAAHPIFGATTQRTADGVELILDQHEIGLRVEDGPIDRVLDEPFTLEGGELMRCVLSGDRLLLVWHHLVVDGWSVRVFLDDLGRCFDDPEYRPVAPRLTPCDVNAWLHAQAQQQTDRLVKTASELSAIGDFPDRFPAQDKAELRPLSLGRDLTKRLRAKARAEGLLPYSYMCAAYQDALRAVLGAERFLLGCVVAGRNLPELRRVSGWYVNTELVVSTSGTVRAAEQTLTRTHADQDGLPIALLAYHLRTKGVKAPQFIFSVDEEYTLTIQGKPCEKVQLWSPRAIRDTNLVLLTGPDDVYGYFEHRLAFLSIDEAATLVETFLATLEGLVGG